MGPDDFCYSADAFSSPAGNREDRLIRMVMIRPGQHWHRRCPQITLPGQNIRPLVRSGIPSHCRLRSTLRRWSQDLSGSWQESRISGAGIPAFRRSLRMGCVTGKQGAASDRSALHLIPCQSFLTIRRSRFLSSVPSSQMYSSFSVMPLSTARAISLPEVDTS